MLHRTCPYLPVCPDLFERVPNRSSMPERIGGVLPGYQHSISITEVGVYVNYGDVILLAQSQEMARSDFSCMQTTLCVLFIFTVVALSFVVCVTVVSDVGVVVVAGPHPVSTRDNPARARRAVPARPGTRRPPSWHRTGCPEPARRTSPRPPGTWQEYRGDLSWCGWC